MAFCSKRFRQQSDWLQATPKLEAKICSTPGLGPQKLISYRQEGGDLSLPRPFPYILSLSVVIKWGRQTGPSHIPCCYQCQWELLRISLWQELQTTCF